MPAKATGPATAYQEIDRFDRGVGWLAHSEETMQRASHALATEDGVYLVDPVDAPGVDDLVAEFGEIAGVMMLSNHHTRDADVFARRHDVPVHVPSTMPAETVDGLDARLAWSDPGDRFGDYELIEVAVGSALGAPWHEYGLWNGATLVVGESVGAAPYLRVGDERLGVMLLRRLDPPRDALGDLAPERVLSGHGPGVHEDATAALDDALANARRRYPRAVLENGVDQVRTVLAALRS